MVSGSTCGCRVHVGGDRRHVRTRDMNGHHSDEAGDLGRAQLGDREVAARRAAVAAGERMAACAGGDERRLAALQLRRLCLPVPAATAEKERHSRCGREQA